MLEFFLHSVLGCENLVEEPGWRAAPRHCRHGMLLVLAVLNCLAQRPLSPGTLLLT